MYICAQVENAMYNNSARSDATESRTLTRQLLPKWSEMKRGLNTTEGPNNSPPSKHPKRQKLQQNDEPQEEDYDEVIEASSTFKRPQNSSEELFNHWRNFLIRDSFTGNIWEKLISPVFCFVNIIVNLFLFFIPKNFFSSIIGETF